MLRAVIAWQSIFQQTPIEAYYPALYVDSDGKKLDGSKGSYTLRFEADNLPPVDAFWSISLYDLAKRLMVPNKISRYSIGDRTSGIAYDPDGSLEIHIQTDDPGGDQSSNWLPAPNEPFYLMFRAYQPQSKIISGRYEFPPVNRV
ncbi:DUF1214 domain-containing protein [Cognatiyoonia sediminum]|uniref:DUF1214 domain-containing protein n=1 Tax=Cognatiyoonia sediminum TaxID=1508389 RepID=UPI002418477C|nr:DUF1214 domain-containing protein [Cognatiyoonia sediminum]